MNPVLSLRSRRSLRAAPRLIVLLLLLAAPAWAVSAAVAGDGLNIVAWNVEWYPGKKNFARGEEMRAHADVVREELRRINPDIFLAQEMRDWDSFARLTDAVPDLRPAVVSAFTSRRTGEYWRQQLGIASKLPVMAAWSERWAMQDEVQPPRGFAAALVRLPGPGRRHLLVYSLHFKSNLAANDSETEINYRERDESTRQLLAHIREMKENAFKEIIIGVIVGGDFNTNQDGQFGDNVMKMMEEAGFHQTWAGAPKADRATWRGSDLHQPTTFDHIFTLGLGKPRAELLTVSEETSDHWPVRIVISPEDLAKARPLVPAAP
ncbi:MAG: endonuclease/exonuclease/phosphatase family protein [Chthoniobacterales bacterium]